MHYNQRWMGYGIVGALEAGGIALVVAALLMLALERATHRHGWSHGRQLAVAYLLALALAASGDMWDLFYLNVAPLQSLPLLAIELAQVHDPDNLGLRVLAELCGAAVGVFVVWAILARRGRPRG